MFRPNRREFLKSVSAASLLPLEQTRAELILHHGNIFTIDDRQPKAEAVAIAGGRFFAVGSNDDVLNLKSAATRRIDLEGKTVVPGFIDAHTHLGYSGLRHLTRLDCDLRSIDAIKDAIRAYAQETPVGEWVAGFKYDDTKTAEGRALTRADLDEVAPEHPVFIEHRGGHTAYVNSLALERAGIGEDTPDPQGGHRGRDASGRLNGKLEENAAFTMSALLPAEFSREQAREGVKLISAMMARSGVTSAHDALGAPDDLRAYQDSREAGELALRVYTLIDVQYLDAMIEAGVRTGLGDEWVKVGPVKLLCDGSISERTARLSEPFIGSPDDYGILVTEEGELYAQARKAHEAGWQVAVHANGDVGIDITLRVLERVQRELPREDPRFRLEHCTIVNDDLIARIRSLGAIPNPFSTYVYYHGEKMIYLRRRAAGAHVRGAELPRCGDQSDADFGLPARAFRADDGAPIERYAHGHERNRVGPESKSERFGSDPRGHAARRARLVRGKRQRLDRSGKARRPRRARPRSDRSRPVDAHRYTGRAHDGGRAVGARSLKS